MCIDIRPYRSADKDALVALSLRAWQPVFEKLQPAVPGYVYDAFYPDGWQPRQSTDVTALLEGDDNHVLVAVRGETVVGWVGTRLHPEDSMGEIHILAVDPAAQRCGVATSLMQAAMARMRAAGMAIAMVETGGDPGHAPSRATYECAGFERWPVARYFREL